MFEAAGILVAKTGRGGRPKKEDGERTTRHVRVFADLADMIGEIIDVEQGTAVANLLDPWLRPHVEARHATLKAQIDQMKKARAQAAAKKQQRKEE